MIASGWWSLGARTQASQETTEPVRAVESHLQFNFTSGLSALAEASMKTPGL